MAKEEKKVEYTILTTDNGLTYEDYIDWCECNETEPKGRNSEEYFDFLYETDAMYYEDDRIDLKYSKLNERSFIIDGSLGLWDGRREIKPVICNGLLNAIDKCIGSCDAVDVKLNTKDGVIYVKAPHHDGTNCFTLRLLNKNGEKWAETQKDCYNCIEDYNNHWWSKIKSIEEIW